MAYISDYTTIYGYPPSVRDTATYVGRAVSTVHYHLNRLEEAGLVRSAPNKARTYQVLTKEDT